MDLSTLVTEPKLTKITLDAPEIVEKYGDTIVFWAYDNIQLSTYFKFFDTRLKGEYEDLEAITRALILKEDGTQMISDGKTLPPDIFSAAIVAIGELLGKSQSKTST